MVNKTRVTESVTLHNGDCIRIGLDVRHCFVFHECFPNIAEIHHSNLAALSIVFPTAENYINSSDFQPECIFQSIASMPSDCLLLCHLNAFVMLPKIPAEVNFFSYFFLLSP